MGAVNLGPAIVAELEAWAVETGYRFVLFFEQARTGPVDYRTDEETAYLAELAEYANPDATVKAVRRDGDVGWSVTTDSTPGIDFIPSPEDGEPGDQFPGDIMVAGVFGGVGTAMTMLTKLLAAASVAGVTWTLVGADGDGKSGVTGALDSAANTVDSLFWLLLLLGGGYVYYEVQKGG